MKNKVIVLCLTASMVMGCTGNKQETANTEVSKTEESINTAKAIIDLENYNMDYNEKTDSQPFFNWSHVAKTENGYYLWGSGNYDGYLMFLDKKTGQIVPVCNLPNCNHTDKNCHAYFPSDGGSDMDSTSNTPVWYNEDSLYVIGYDKEDYMNLYKVKLDGSESEKYMSLYKADTTDPSGSEGELYSFPELIIHRGYVYYIDGKESMPKIRKMKLGTDKTEVIYETQGKRPNLYRMEAYGDYIFFQTGNFVDEDMIEIDGGLYAYNIETGNITLIKKGITSSYIIQGTDIYYSMDGEERKFSLLSQEDVKIADGWKGYAEISVDKNYIYILANDTQLKVYDSQLNLIHNKNTELAGWYMGDDNFMFGSFNDGTTVNVRKFDKSKLESKTAGWEVMF